MAEGHDWVGQQCGQERGYNFSVIRMFHGLKINNLQTPEMAQRRKGNRSLNCEKMVVLSSTPQESYDLGPSRESCQARGAAVQPGLCLMSRW